MKTRDLIKEAGRELFNQKGVMNVTLREVADGLKKSYGNITYHFATKAVLIEALFEDMNRELSALQQPSFEVDLLRYFLRLPSDSYGITTKYLFFTVDQLYIKRNYPELFKHMDRTHKERGAKWLQLLMRLRDEGFLQQDLLLEDLQYIMLLSVSVRSTYFQMKEPSTYDEASFVAAVNQLLKPYLSKKGLQIYQSAI